LYSVVLEFLDTTNLSTQVELTVAMAAPEPNPEKKVKLERESDKCTCRCSADVREAQIKSVDMVRYAGVRECLERS
jgi:transposase-like protein